MVEDRVPTAVVTGAGGTIGRSLCLQLAAKGADVLAVDLSEDALAGTVAEVHASEGAAGRACVAHAADVTSEADVAGYVEAAVQRWGRIDWFANNAGIEGPAAPLTAFSSEAFRRVMDVNVFGVFLGLKHVLPVMRDGGGGSVVNTASVAGLYATPQLVAYGASKHAVIGLTRTAAVEHAGDRIKVNAVCPGAQEGRMIESIEASLAPDDPRGARAAFIATIPMGRYGRPPEVAETIAWLLAEAPEYLTGQTVVIDGGAMVA